jgi:hypothetical protein
VASTGHEQRLKEELQASKRRGLKDVTGSYQDTGRESLDIVRPGRFFSTLLAMQAELEQRLVSLGLGSDDSGEAALRVLRQLEAIRLEALVALDRMQRQRFHEPPIGINVDDFVSAQSVSFDYELDMQQ